MSSWSRRTFVGTSLAALAACQSPGNSGGNASSNAPTRVNLPPPSPPRLPMGTVFKGEAKFQQLMARGRRENWARQPLGHRTATVGRALIGIPYENFTLEIDDRIESPSVNFNGLDCWTYYEIALGCARMLKLPEQRQTPLALLHMIEIERYRNGVCNGSYTSRMHHLEEVFHDNERRGLGTNVTRSLGGERLQRQVRYMPTVWRSYRYLRNNPELVPELERIEARISTLPVYHIPKNRVAGIENRLQNGDVIAITSTWKHGYTSHVGLALREGSRCRFMHATSENHKGRRTIIDGTISSYLSERANRAGIIVFRPVDVFA